MPKLGKTTGNLKMRSGPGMEFEPPIAYLTPGTELEIVEDLGDWLHVKAVGKDGYVGQKYVEVTGEATPAPAPVAQAAAPVAPAPAPVAQAATPAPTAPAPAAPPPPAKPKASGGIGKAFNKDGDE